MASTHALRRSKERNFFWGGGCSEFEEFSSGSGVDWDFYRTLSVTIFDLLSTGNILDESYVQTEFLQFSNATSSCDM
jgi:hypothetical protein